MNLKGMSIALAITTWIVNAQVPASMSTNGMKVDQVSAALVKRVNQCLTPTWKVWPNCFLDLGVSIGEKELFWLESQWLSVRVGYNEKRRFVQEVINTENTGSKRTWSLENSNPDKPSKALPTPNARNTPSCANLLPPWWLVQSDPNTGSMVNWIRCN